MAEIQSVDVGGIQYNVAPASAVKQKKLLNLIGGRLSIKSVHNEGDMNPDVILGLLLTLDESLFDDVAGIVLVQTFQHGNETPVTVRDFQGRITDYFLLVAHAIKVNLDDFFTYLAGYIKTAKETKKKAEKKA